MKKFKVTFYEHFIAKNGKEVKAGEEWEIEEENERSAVTEVYDRLPGLYTPMGPVVTFGIREL